MKYRQMVMILGMAVSIFSYTGCTQKEDSTQVESTADEGKNKAEQEEEILYGQVKEITEEKVSVQVGTQKEMEKPEEGEQPDQMSFLELTEEEKDITITDESTVYVDQGAEVNFSDVSIIRQSEDSTGGDNASFYGVGAAFLVTDGTATISDSRVETDADGGAGLFAYGDGVICAENTTITTKKDTSGGVHVAGGGVLYGWDLTAETNGISSAAVRSDGGNDRCDHGYEDSRTFRGIFRNHRNYIWIVSGKSGGI